MSNATFLDFGTVGPGDIDPQPLDDVLPGIEVFDATTDDELPARLAGREFVLMNKVRLGPAEMDAAGRLRFIGLTATGTDNVDLDAARERGIAVCNIRDYCTQSVAQHALALMLTLTQQLVGYRHQAMSGAWGASGQFCMLDYPVRELSGCRLGIIGWGNLGRATARFAEAIGMTIMVAQRPGSAGPAPEGRVALDTLLAEADIISLHCPLTADTHHLIGARELELMRDDALLINTARGALVDTAALADALRAGGIGGAGIDVLEQEPPVDGDPLIGLEESNLIVTPHVAWAAREARQRGIAQTADCVRAFLAGELLNRVD